MISFLWFDISIHGVIQATTLHNTLGKSSSSSHLLRRWNIMILWGGFAGYIPVHVSVHRCGLWHEYLTSTFLDNVIHKFNEVGLLVWFLIHLSEVLDCVVNEVLLLLGIVFTEVQSTEIPLNVVFAFGFNIWLVKKLKSLYHYLQTFIEAFISHLSELPCECLQDFDCGVTKVSVA